MSDAKDSLDPASDEKAESQGPAEDKPEGKAEDKPGGKGEDKPEGKAEDKPEGKAEDKAKDEDETEAVGTDARAQHTERRVEVKVGIFVLIALGAAIAITLVLAQKRHVFERRVLIHTVFHEVGGLREGAPVRLSGVNIGLVARIAFEDRKNSLIHVDMEVSRESLERLGGDSAARIGTQGLLGDKIIELSVGEAPGAALAPGGTIESVPPVDINRVIEKASAVLDQVKVTADNAAAFTSHLANPKALADLDGILASAHALGHAAEKGPGLVHSVFYDPRQAQTFRSILASVDRVGHEVNQAIAHVNAVLGATDSEGKQIINHLSRAATKVGDAAGRISDSKIIPNLDRASGDLADLTAYVKSGQGTIGLALMDPTVYEQLLTVLGGVARSRVLRALVRYAISRDPGQKAGRVVDGKR